MIDYQLIHSAEAYRSMIPGVARLFAKVFRRALPGDIWKQWHLDHPSGIRVWLSGIAVANSSRIMRSFLRSWREEESVTETDCR